MWKSLFNKSCITKKRSKFKNIGLTWSWDRFRDKSPNRRTFRNSCTCYSTAVHPLSLWWWSLFFEATVVSSELLDCMCGLNSLHTCVFLWLLLPCCVFCIAQSHITNWSMDEIHDLHAQKWSMHTRHDSGVHPLRALIAYVGVHRLRALIKKRYQYLVDRW